MSFLSHLLAKRKTPFRHHKRRYYSVVLGFENLACHRGNFCKTRLRRDAGPRRTANKIITTEESWTTTIITQQVGCVRTHFHYAPVPVEDSPAGPVRRKILYLISALRAERKHRQSEPETGTSRKKFLWEKLHCCSHCSSKNRIRETISAQPVIRLTTL